MGAPRQQERSVECRRRRMKVEKMLLRGVTNQRQIAAALHVSTTTIGKDVHAIREQWIRDDPKTVKTRRAKRVRQFESILQMAANGYDRSRADGSPGDPRMLAVMKSCVAEVSRLEGLYPNRKTTEGRKALDVRAHILHAHLYTDSKKNPWLKAPPEVVIEAKEVLAKLLEAADENQPLVLEAPRERK